MSMSSSSSRDGSSSTTIARFAIASRKRRGMEARASATRRSNSARRTGLPGWALGAVGARLKKVALVLHRALITERLRLANAAAVPVHRQPGDAECVAEDDIRRLAADAGQLDERLHAGRPLPLVPLDERA